MSSNKAASLPTPAPDSTTVLLPLDKRGGGGVYTGTLATGPPSPIYAKHTTINGSRPGFIVVVIIAGLIFFALLGGGYWLFRRRRRRNQGRMMNANGVGGSSRRYSTSNTKRISGLFGAARKSMSANNGNASGGGGRGGAGKWTTLNEEDDEDAFAMAPSTNVSMMDLNDPHYVGHGNEYPKKWNPVYAASGESVNLTSAVSPRIDVDSENNKDAYLKA